MKNHKFYLALYQNKQHTCPILDYERWARFLGSQPAGDISHKPGARLPLLSTRPTVTFPAKEITPALRRYQIILLGDRGTQV